MQMKSSKTAANQFSNLPLSEAIRNALGVFVNVVSIEAQKVAAERSLERATFKSRIDEMAAANGALNKTILDLGVKQADQVVKTEAAKKEAAITHRQMAAMTEEAARLADKTAVQVKTWRNRLQSVLMSVQALIAEVDAGQEEQGIQRDRVENGAPEDERAIEPFVTAKRVCSEREGRCQREEADFVAAATILLRAAGRFGGHHCALPGPEKGPLNELRGSKSDDVLEPEVAREFFSERKDSRKTELRGSRDSAPQFSRGVVDSSPMKAGDSA
jgi:hypothetical protein